MDSPSRPASPLPPANPTVVPGSLFATRGLWQQVADSLPTGTMLVVLPAGDGVLRRALESVAFVLRAQGHPVTTVPAPTSPTTQGIQGSLLLPTLS